MQVMGNYYTSDHIDDVVRANEHHHYPLVAHNEEAEP